MRFCHSILLLSVLTALNVPLVRAQPGSIDLTFDPGSGVRKNGSATVSVILVQPDGRILIGGDFTTVNGTARPRIARLTSSGQVDNSFNVGSGPSDAVLAALLQPDGNVLIAGSFTNVNGIVRGRIARLKPDGSVDATFDPGAGADWDVNALYLQADGKVLLGGSFAQVNGSPRNALARLDSTGKLDGEFLPQLSGDAYVGAIMGQGEKLVVAGLFSGPSGSPQRLARLTSTGAIDSSFQMGSGPDSDVLSMVTDNGGVVIVGSFSKVNNTVRNRVARLKADGSLDNTFDPGAGPDADVLAAALQPDGKVIIAGDLQHLNGVPKNGVARLNPDGKLDEGFNAGSGVNGSVQALALQSDGRVLVGGFISSVDGVSRNGIARLLGDAPALVQTHWSVSSGFSVSVATVQGKSYVLEYVNNLGEAWSSLPAVAGDGTVKTLTDPSASGLHRFYRVRVQ